MPRARSKQITPGAEARGKSKATTTDAPVAARTGRRYTLDQFSDQARRALEVAVAEARRLSHAEIRPEHLRLGLAAVRAPSAPELRMFVPEMRLIEGSGLGALRDALSDRGGSLDARPIDGAPALSDAAKRVVHLAIEEAGRTASPQVGTEHLLVGLVSEGSALDAGTMTALALRGLRMAMGIRPSGRFRAPDAVGIVQGVAPGGTRDNVVTLRVTDADIAAVDALVEVGISRTRSEAAAWLLHAGLQANRSLFERAQGIVEEVRRLREEAQRLVLQDTPPEETHVDVGTADQGRSGGASSATRAEDEAGGGAPAPTRRVRRKAATA